MARDQGTMEQIIDKGIRLRLDQTFLNDRVLKDRLFSVGDGRSAVLLAPFNFSSVKKIRILDGRHTGEEAWVHERFLKAKAQ